MLTACPWYKPVGACQIKAVAVTVTVGCCYHSAAPRLHGNLFRDSCSFTLEVCCASTARPSHLAEMGHSNAKTLRNKIWKYYQAPTKRAQSCSMVLPGMFQPSIICIALCSSKCLKFVPDDPFSAVQRQHNYQKQDKLFHMVLHLPVALASVSGAVASVLSSEFGRSSLIIPNSVDCNRFFPGPPQAQMPTSLLVASPAEVTTNPSLVPCHVVPWHTSPGECLSNTWLRLPL